MDGMIEKKELRNFGLIVGGIFFLIGIWPAIWHGEELRLWAVVPGSLLIPLGLVAPTILAPWRAIDRIRFEAGHPRAPLQILDEGRPCHGVDQYQDHSRDSVLWAYHSDGGGHAAVRLGLDAESAKPRQ